MSDTLILDTVVTHATAVAANERGFPQNMTYSQYMADGKTMTDNHYKRFLHEEDEEALIAAPTQNQLQKWLREQHGYHVFVEPQSLNDSSLGWTANGHTLKSFNVTYHSFMPRIISTSHDTYEEALESGLLTVLTDIV